MQPDVIEIIYVDHAYKGKTLSRSSTDPIQVNGASSEPDARTTIVNDLLCVFDRVHLCSKGEQAVSILEARDVWNPQATMVMVTVDSRTIESSPVVVNTEIAGDLVLSTASGLRGEALLAWLNSECRRRKLPWIMTAAIVEHPSTEIFRTLIDLGTTDCIQLPLHGIDVQRLAAALYRRFRKRIRTRQLQTPDDANAYERQDTIPSDQEWNALHTRVQTIYLQDLSNNQRMLDHHMPVPEVAQVPDDTYFTQPQYLSDVRRLQNVVATWHFASLGLSDTDLITCSFVMFRHVLDLPGNEEWQISDRKLYEFLLCTRALYHASNSYHNFRHAVDVQQALFYFLYSAGALPPMNDSCAKVERTGENSHITATMLTPQHMLASLIVGIGHDVGHPGVTNAFLISTKSPLALMYNDRSVLENLHCAALGRTLAKTWPAAQEPVMRKIIMELILATDMALHFDYMSKFKEMEVIKAQRLASKDKSPLPEAMREKCRITLFSGLVKCADISNVARPFNISMDWSIVLLREFFNQGRLEKALGLTITPMLNPENTIQANSQVFFIDMFALPLFRSFELALPCLQPIVSTLLENRDAWKTANERKSDKETTFAADGFAPAMVAEPLQTGDGYPGKCPAVPSKDVQPNATPAQTPEMNQAAFENPKSPTSVIIQDEHSQPTSNGVYIKKKPLDKLVSLFGKKAKTPASTDTN